MKQLANAVPSSSEIKATIDGQAFAGEIVGPEVPRVEVEYDGLLEGATWSNAPNHPGYRCMLDHRPIVDAKIVLPDIGEVALYAQQKPAKPSKADLEAADQVLRRICQ